MRTDANPLTFDGQPVDGSHNMNLNSSVGRDNAGDPHVGVAAYYIATIVPSKAIVDPARSSWFQPPNPPRDKVGFYYSRIVNGVRPSDGVAKQFGGSADRFVVGRKGTQWGNVRDVSLVGNETTVAAGKTIRVRFRFGDSDSVSTVAIFLDKDQNPYNDNTVSRIARRNYHTTANGGARLSGTTVEASPGTYYVYAQISDNDGHVRYAYMHEALHLTAPTAAMKFASVKNGVLTVSGTSGVDRILATTNGTSFAVTKHDFTQVFSAAGIHGIVIDGFAGNDSIGLGPGMPGALIRGGEGNDTLVGSDGDDRIEGGPGKDHILGGAGNDRLSGGGGNDRIEGNGGADRLYGDAGNDMLFGGKGKDYLVGGSGIDSSDGQADTDRAERDPFDTFVSVETILG
jgi:Ca2+-binding RTX toxin-like protein